MKIKDQIRSRREQLGVTIQELARRVGVSHQSIRYWEQGRSFPGKSKAPKLEDALSFRLDWTQGVRSRSERPDATALLDQEDIRIMLVLRRLPPSMKKAVENLANLYLDALEVRGSFTAHEREDAIGTIEIAEAEAIRRSPRRPSHKTRKRAA